MGQPAAKEGDSIEGKDTHYIISVSLNITPPGKPGTFTFDGIIDGNLSENVYIMKNRAATVESTATNEPNHIEIDDKMLPKDAKFMGEPSNEATIKAGSSSVFIDGKAAARNGDTANTCNDLSGVPVDSPNGTVKASGTVMIG